MLIIKAVLAVIFNLIIYFAFGSMMVCRNDTRKSVVLSLGTGFFAYYSLFFLVVLPLMFTYRTLSLLTVIWGIFAGTVVLLALVFKREIMTAQISSLFATVRRNPGLSAIIAAVILIQVIVIVRSYDFTLDAAYYVANVTTSLDTNMINIYDPFTGAWQDHFELRYVFATYSINDAVLCRIFGLPALVVTKTVMASTVSILANVVCLGLAAELFKDNMKKICIMMCVIMWVNFTFITVYTASNFLITRTYEGKAVLGNITTVLIFLLFIILVSGDKPKLYWLMLFWVSMGSSTITSSANMLVPAEISLLMVPYIIKKRKWKEIPCYLAMLIPGLVMMLIYVLYVKGFFAIHTYYRR